MSVLRAWARRFALVLVCLALPPGRGAGGQHNGEGNGEGYCGGGADEDACRTTAWAAGADNPTHDFATEGAEVLESGDAWHARDYFRVALARNPQSPAAWRLLGEAALQVHASTHGCPDTHPARRC